MPEYLYLTKTIGSCENYALATELVSVCLFFKNNTTPSLKKCVSF